MRASSATFQKGMNYYHKTIILKFGCIRPDDPDIQYIYKYCPVLLGRFEKIIRLEWPKIRRKLVCPYLNQNSNHRSIFILCRYLSQKNFILNLQ